jgi:hypothetical protein
MSNLIHPCGYWEYIQKEFYNVSTSKPTKHNSIEKFVVSSENSKDYIDFNWTDFFEKNRSFIPASACLFIEQQHEGMCSSAELISKYFPISHETKNYLLSCKFKNNPRGIWNSIEKLTQNDLSEIFTKIGCFKILNDEVLKKDLLNTLPSMILMPKTIDKAFIQNPSLNVLSHGVSLNISCLHREQINLEIQETDEDKIFNCLPHLLNIEDGLNLDETNIGIDYLTMIILTCLDLAKSQVSCFIHYNKR